MLVGTYVRHGSYVTVAVEVSGAATAPAAVVLERSERPGSASARVACELESLSVAVRHAEGLVLSRGGWLGAEAEGIAGSPVERRVAERMFSVPELRRYVHLPVRRRGG
jgi:hypothetical protein